MANKNPYKKESTLCCNCATPSPTCPWKYNFTPVDGWEAEETELKMVKTSNNSCRSYLVRSCPLFTKNERVIVKEEIPDIPGLRSKFQRMKKRENKC